MMKNSYLFEIDHFSPAYDEAIHLREKYLRIPLNMAFSAKDIIEERDQYHLALCDLYSDNMIGCLTLKPQYSNKVQFKMRQVVVDENYRNQGYGRVMVRASEKFAKAKGANVLYCHARENVLEFYLSMDYEKEGEIFEEVGIPHIKMWKALS